MAPGGGTLWPHNETCPPSQARGPGPPSTREVPGSQEGSDLVRESVLALPQLGGDRDAEVSRESTVTKGSLASGLEKKGLITEATSSAA